MKIVPFVLYENKAAGNMSENTMIHVYEICKSSISLMSIWVVNKLVVRFAINTREEKNRKRSSLLKVSTSALINGFSLISRNKTT